MKKSMQNLLASSLIASVSLWAPHASASEPFIGQIMMFAGNFAPAGWAQCDGQLLAINQNAAMFSILGTMFGGDGETTFGLPDLRGRSPVHQGSGPGLPTATMGQKGGATSFSLNTNNLPNHSHSATASITSTAVSTLSGLSATLYGANVSGDKHLPGGNALASKSRTNIYSSDDVPNVAMHTDSIEINGGTVNTTVTSTSSVSIGNTGGNQAVSHRSPYQVVNFIIALDGFYPSQS